ncbi:MAG TPA: hypothetical protein VER58_03550 [Thermoanaerobaculia bacterium]|nr:hypothetical protein [Thermoanaerobaculia bacterium]
MIALLRYAYLKSVRDGSLIAFLLPATLVSLSGLSGVTLSQGHRPHYPFFLNVQFSPVQNATLAAQIAIAVSVLFAVIPAFWTFRPEISSRSIGSFFFATRPLTVALALILFAAAVGLAGWIVSMAVIGVLTTALPTHMALMALKVAAGCLAASAIGALVVTISPQPGAIVISYVGCIALVPWIEKSKSSLQLIAAVAASIVCAALSAYLLERRCAT